ncbi:MAG: LuxR family transcriptional regulator [Chloroflexi bacterium]|nr:LuxR family transcriptional regulator [Chloroflexota bacterium]
MEQHLEGALQKRFANNPQVFNNGSWPGDHDLFATMADTAAQRADEPMLRRYAPLAEALAMRYGHVLYQAVAHRAWGVAHRLAGEYPSAETRFQQALALFQQLGTPWQTGRTLADLGDLERARGDAVRAHDYLSRALAGFEEVQALPDAARARAALEALGPKRQHPSPESHGGPVDEGAPPTPGEPLTAREMEVLRWLAQGLSDKEIADRLVISVHTVRGHLRSVYAKLDVPSRSAAMRAALDRRLI